jgi:16S rRNA (cytosine967-C5)-methyltransferase
MTPAARVQACIQILSAIQAGHLPDRALHDWGKTHKFAGSGDRRALADTIYDILRHRAFLAWAMQGDSHPRALVIAWAYHLKKIQKEDLEHLFSGEKYAAGQLIDKERQALNTPLPRKRPFEAIYNMPAWMEEPLKRALGDDLDHELSLLNERAPLDLRVNTLKVTLQEVIDAFDRQGIDVEKTAYAPSGLRMVSPVSLKGNSLYEQGHIEVQDEGSQLASVLLNPVAGESVLDYCAGGGGKTLSLAALMENKGEIIASDLSEKRLQSIKSRAERAGVTIIRALNQARLHPEKKSFDRVLVDAPCSGSGTWRRNAGARWDLLPEDLDSFAKTQRQILDQAAPFVKKGGRLGYVTCSLFQEENEQVVTAFLQAHPEFKAVSVKNVWQDLFPDGVIPPRVEETARFTTYHTGSDSFFVALFERI